MREREREREREKERDDKGWRKVLYDEREMVTTPSPLVTNGRYVLFMGYTSTCTCICNSEGKEEYFVHIRAFC